MRKGDTPEAGTKGYVSKSKAKSPLALVRDKAFMQHQVRRGKKSKPERGRERGNKGLRIRLCKPKNLPAKFNGRKEGNGGWPRGD